MSRRGWLQSCHERVEEAQNEINVRAEARNPERDGEKHKREREDGKQSSHKGRINVVLKVRERKGGEENVSV